MKIISISKTFPNKHKRQGEKTLFNEKICNAIKIDFLSKNYLQLLCELNEESIKLGKLTIEQLNEYWSSLSSTSSKKETTIRANPKVNQGDEFQFFVWSDKPYRSPIIRVTPPLRVYELQPIKISNTGIHINKQHIHEHWKVAQADGLKDEDFVYWFLPDMPFSGKRIKFTKTKESFIK